MRRNKTKDCVNYKCHWDTLSIIIKVKSRFFIFYTSPFEGWFTLRLDPKCGYTRTGVRVRDLVV